MENWMTAEGLLDKWVGTDFQELTLRISKTYIILK
jgi:hypothetical protein